MTRDMYGRISGWNFRELIYNLWQNIKKPTTTNPRTDEVWMDGVDEWKNMTNVTGI